jgi:hypothetical protein
MMSFGGDHSIFPECNQSVCNRPECLLASPKDSQTIERGAGISVTRMAKRVGDHTAAGHDVVDGELKVPRLRSGASVDKSSSLGRNAQPAYRRDSRGAPLAPLKTSVQVTEPKSARSRRTIALPTVAVTVLRAHRVRQLEARLAAGVRWQDHGFVFTSSIGTALDPRNVTRDFKALLVAADLPNIRSPQSAALVCDALLAQGVNPRVVMETLGHSQVSLTLNTYSHVLPALQREAAAKTNAVFAES